MASSGRTWSSTLLGDGARVRALAQYNSFNSWGWLEAVARLDEVEVVTGDVRNPHFCQGWSRAPTWSFISPP